MQRQDDNGEGKDVGEGKSDIEAPQAAAIQSAILEITENARPLLEEMISASNAAIVDPGLIERANQLVNSFVNNREVRAGVGGLFSKLNKFILKPASATIIGYSVTLAAFAQLAWWPDVRKAATYSLFYAGLGPVAAGSALQMAPKNKLTKILSECLDKTTEGVAIFTLLNEVITRTYVAIAQLAGEDTDEIDEPVISDEIALLITAASLFVSITYLSRELSSKFAKTFPQLASDIEPGSLSEKALKILDFTYKSFLMSAALHEVGFQLALLTDTASQSPKVEIGRNAFFVGCSVLLASLDTLFQILPKNVVALLAALSVALGSGLVLGGKNEYSGEIGEYQPWMILTAFMFLTAAPIAKKLYSSSKTAVITEIEGSLDEENPRAITSSRSASDNDEKEAEYPSGSKPGREMRSLADVTDRKETRRVEIGEPKDEAPKKSPKKPKTVSTSTHALHASPDTKSKKPQPLSERSPLIQDDGKKPKGGGGRKST